jgi:Arc/MetJ-type ribon-helix-helix transcriptional regulator
MPAKQSRPIALIETRAAWIGGQVTQGGYASTSDLIRKLRMPHGKGQA